MSGFTVGLALGPAASMRDFLQGPEERFLADVLGGSLRAGMEIPVGISWSRVFDLAVANGVTSHLHSALSDAALRPPAAAQLWQHLNQRGRDKAMRGLALRAEQRRLAKEFAASGIEALWLKGPLLADLHYRKPALREFGDLDLLVRPEDRNRAWQLLLRLGYDSPYENKELHLRYQIAFWHRERNECVELHWRIAGPQNANFFTGDFLREHILKKQCNDVSILVPRVEAHLLYLALHAYKHDWARLQWIWDIPEIVRSAPDLDWDLLWRMACHLRTTRILRATFDLARAVAAEFQGPPQGHPAGRPILRESQFRLISAAIGQRLTSGGQVAAFLRLRLGLADTVGARADMIWHALQPSDRDKEWLPLPNALVPLYVVVRPIRLLGRVFGGGHGVDPHHRH